MEKLKYLAALTGHIIRTVTGFYDAPFSHAWDEELSSILNEGELLDANGYVATFAHSGNIYEVWVANRWFAFAELYCLNGEYIERRKERRPRFRTMYRLHQMVQTHLALAKEV